MLFLRFAIYGFIFFSISGYIVFNPTQSNAEGLGNALMVGAFGAGASVIAAFSARLLFQFYSELLRKDHE